MPWVRIDENALTHPKIFELSHGSFRLWVAGLAHCQQHLTDGFMSHAIVRTLIAVSAPRIDELVSAGLWERVTSGFQVHDYLQHNDSREKVLRARQQGHNRRRRWEEKHNASGNASANASGNASAPSGVVCSEDSPKLLRREGGSGETLPQRAGAFSEWYGEAHEKYVGVGYIGSPHKDYDACLRLCEKFSDTELRDAALVWFGMDDDFATRGTRTLTKFASRASDCVLRARKVGA